ncbi:malate dehydrogenase (oxaloacetate-decarboxylating) [Sporomusaceae bacterium BoRhaA]|uniref:NAD(P)-dependent malic enzyme n=1 Tax=Pelorhabdus rhamnosifermentans TaxID=2772457 RepID=UPI001C05F643|nr:NADP-dependent malic enzyme [Pelorhabdus rhamnosifermentans]MBU2699916.1 malate dehydrogenase (oxaloacetate-decarboxylating) [Pelorhabdus rhamnosifermentans]
MDIYEKSLALHKQLRGKIAITSKMSVTNKNDLALAYSPGVAEPCRQIAKNEEDVYDYTAKGNMVAVVSDGSAVLGLGNIGPKAAIPVMEGKAILFKNLANVDAVPICLDTQDTEEIIKTVKYLAPTFGAINLEDIAAPRCFEIERRLKEELDIPVFHDDQHGTAICVLAGLINAHKVVNKDLTESQIVINGAGAAGIAIGKLLLAYGAKQIVMVDKEGIINHNNPQTLLNDGHREIAKVTNPEQKTGNLRAALIGADVFVGVSRPGLVTKEMVTTMNKDAILFAMANPEPEIFPDEAKQGGAAVVGTGRSDFPNMINNVVAFPGMLKGALAVRASDINQNMYLAAAIAIANSVSASELTADYVFPEPLNPKTACIVAKAVAQAAKHSGVARI